MRFGQVRPGGPSQHPSGLPRATGIVPANAGIGDSVQQNLDALASASARRQEEAISNIDGVDLYLWQRMTSGVVCSCQGGQAPTVPNIDPNVISVDDSASEPSVNDGFDRVRVKAVDVSPAYRHEEWSNPFVSDAEPAHHFGATTDADVDQDTFVDVDALLHGDDRDRVSPGGPGQNPADHEYDHTDGAFDDQLMADYENEMIDGWDTEALLANAYLLGVTNTACPLCFNIGIVGGYDLWGGTHRILPVEHATDSHNAMLDDEGAAVPSWTVQPGGFVVWKLSLASYFKVAWTLARNDCRSAQGFQFAFSIGDGESLPKLQAFSQAALDDFTVRVTNVSNIEQRLTHVDLAMRHMELKGQVTNLNLQAGLDQRIKADAITVTLPAKVGFIDANSIITDMKYNLVWRSSSIETISDNKRRVTSVSVQTKLVGPSEIESLLQPHYNVRIVDQNLYGGVEAVQGAR